MPKDALRAGQLGSLVMLEAGERLRDDGKPPAGEVHGGGEIVLQFRLRGVAGYGAGVDGNRLAGGGEITPRQVEKVDRLFENPVAHAGR